MYVHCGRVKKKTAPNKKKLRVCARKKCLLRRSISYFIRQASNRIQSRRSRRRRRSEDGAHESNASNSNRWRLRARAHASQPRRHPTTCATDTTRTHQVHTELGNDIDFYLLVKLYLLRIFYYRRRATKTINYFRPVHSFACVGLSTSSQSLQYTLTLTQTQTLILASSFQPVDVASARIFIRFSFRILMNAILKLF